MPTNNEDKSLTIGIEIKANTAEGEEALETLKKVKQEAETVDDMPGVGDAATSELSDRTGDPTGSRDDAAGADRKFQQRNRIPAPPRAELSQRDNRHPPGRLEFSALADALAAVVSRMNECQKLMKEMEGRTRQGRGAGQPGDSADEFSASREKMKAFQTNMDGPGALTAATQSTGPAATQTEVTAAQSQDGASATVDSPDILGQAQTVSRQSRQTLEAASQVLTTVIANQASHLELVRSLGRAAAAQAQDIAAVRREVADVRGQLRSLIRGSYNQ